MAQTESIDDDIQIKSKVWFERDGRVALSDWRVALLESIEKTGSLSAACNEMNVPYRTAWYKLKEIEEQLGVRLLDTQTGGAEGGGTRLTAEGRDVIERYRRASRGIARLIGERFAAEFGDWRN